VSSKPAKHLRYDYAGPNLPSATLRKGLLLLLQSARGLGMEMEGLDGLAEVLERVTAADGLDELHRLTAYRTCRNTASRGIDQEQTPLCAKRVTHVASVSGVDLCSDKYRWLSDPLTDASSEGPMARSASPQWLCPNATGGIAVVHESDGRLRVVHGNHPISVGLNS
jgi:hypothetical protein